LRGHINERSPGRWRIVVSAGFDDAGKRRQIVRTVRGSKREAERELTRMLRDRDQGTLADGGRLRLADYLQREWLPAVSAVSKRGRPLAPTTRQRYAEAVGHTSRIIGRVRLADLRPKHVEKLRNALLAEKRFAPQTVGDMLRVLSQALSRAEALGYVGRNTADSRLVHRPAGSASDFVTIDPELAETILTAVRGTDPWDAAAHLALGIGLRREEVLGLPWGDIELDDDRDAGIVRVRRTLTYAGQEYHFGPPKSKAGERKLELPAFVVRSLRRHGVAQAKRLLVMGKRPGSGDLVIDNGMGEPWLPASFSTGWRRFAKARGFEGVTFHGLRHGAATLLLAAGVPDAVAIDIMGHADTAILRRYQDVVSQLRKDAANRLDALIAGS